MKLYTVAELAAMLHKPEKTALELRRQHGWPSVKIGKTILFTQEHVEQIIAAHEVKPVKKAASATPTIAGQTKRSARRSA